MPRQRISLPLPQLGGIDGSSFGDGEVNCSLRTPLVTVQHKTPRQTRSGRLAVVVPQDAAESLAALDLTGGEADFFARIDQSFVEALVTALWVIVGQERNHGGLQRSPAEKDGVLLRAIDPAGEDEEQQVPWLKLRFHVPPDARFRFGASGIVSSLSGAAPGVTSARGEALRFRKVVAAPVLFNPKQSQDGP